MKQYNNVMKGFTLVELLVVMAVMGILLSLSYVTLLGAQRRSSLNSTVSVLVTDIKQQQLKTMTGDTGGATPSGSYGLYFQPSRYTVFHGTQYQAGQASNYVVNLDPTVSFSSILFPNASLVFATVSGEVVNYASGSSSVIVKDTTSSEQKTIIVNQFGTITIN